METMTYVTQSMSGFPDNPWKLAEKVLPRARIPPAAKSRMDWARPTAQVELVPFPLVPPF